MDDIEEVKRRQNIVDLVQSYLPLKKAGVSWKALCPFHQEKSPSFTVNQERQTYKCFGCSEGGDAIDFLMKMEHLTFPEALQLLADRVGVVLDKRKTPTEYAKEKDEKSRLYKLNRLAAEVFHKVLLEARSAEPARRYLAERGITDTTIETFKLGFAPTVSPGGASILERFLSAKGFTASERRLAGGPERFAGRLMFPLVDTLANPVGFTGRALDPTLIPKYLNTPETSLFKKSRVLYPLHVAKEGIKSAGRAVLVEGQMDVLLAHQLGTTEALATSGTALTAEHLEILRRYTNRIIFAFDADQAGVEATRKAILLAYDLELEPLVAVLPPGYKDLGELALTEPGRWAESLAAALPAVAWQLETATQAAAEPASASGKKQIAREVLPVLVRILDPIEQAHWVQVVARRLGVPDRTVSEALARNKKPETRNQKQADASLPTRVTPVERLLAEEMLLGLLIIYPEQLKRVATRLDAKDFGTETRAGHLARAIAICYTTGELKDSAAFLEGVLKHLEASEGKWVRTLLAEVDRLHPTGEPAVLAQEIEAGFERLRTRRQEVGKARIADAIGSAEASGDRKAVQQLLKELQEMLK